MRYGKSFLSYAAAIVDCRKCFRLTVSEPELGYLPGFWILSAGDMINIEIILEYIHSAAARTLGMPYGNCYVIDLNMPRSMKPAMCAAVRHKMYLLWETIQAAAEKTSGMEILYPTGCFSSNRSLPIFRGKCLLYCAFINPPITFRKNVSACYCFPMLCLGVRLPLGLVPASSLFLL